MSKTLADALTALADIGLTNVVVGQEDDGNIVLILNCTLSDDDSTLEPIVDDLPDDPE
jgi:hypothetical protein